MYFLLPEIMARCGRKEKSHNGIGIGAICVFLAIGVVRDVEGAGVPEMAGTRLVDIQLPIETPACHFSQCVGELPASYHAFGECCPGCLLFG